MPEVGSHDEQRDKIPRPQINRHSIEGARDS